MWADAFLEQARSDWDVYNMIVNSTCPACHGLHYLQMTTEKLGKAIDIKSGGRLENLEKSHKFIGFLRVAARSPRLPSLLCLQNGRQLREYINEILPIAHEIERLAPSLAQGGPNAEYPWKTRVGYVAIPAKYTFPVAKQLMEPRGRKLLKLIPIVLKYFDACF